MEQASSSESGVLAYFDREVVETLRDFQDLSQEWRRLSRSFLARSSSCSARLCRNPDKGVCQTPSRFPCEERCRKETVP